MTPRRWLAAFAFGAFALAAPVAAAAPIDDAQRQVEQAADRVEAAAAALAAVQAEADAATSGYWTAQEAVYALDLDIEQSQFQVDGLSAELVAVRAGVRSMAVERYMSAASPTPLLRSESLAQGVRASALADFATTTQFDVIDEFRVLTAEAEHAQAQLTDQRDERVQRVVEAAAQQSTIAEELAALAERHDALRDELQRFEAAVVVLHEQERAAAEADRARIAAEREAAEARAREAAAVLPPTPVPVAAVSPTAVSGERAGLEATSTPVPVAAEPEPTAVSSGADFVCPLAGPFTHVDDFNSPRAVGGIHRANDLISEIGTPVLAVVAGTLEHRGNTVGGLSAHLKAPNGDYFYYTHLSGYENEGNGVVTAGTVIGYVGMTGNAPIPHLHFEIHQGGYGNYANPYPIIRQYC